MRKPFLILLTIFFIASLALFAEESKLEDDSVDNGLNEEEAIPNYGKMMFLNSIIHGTAQMKLGKREEGLIYLTSVPLTLAGEGILLYTLFARLEIIFNIRLKDDKTFLTEYGKKTLDSTDSLLLFTGTALTLYGKLLSSYSQYAAHRDFIDTYGQRLGIGSVREGRESLAYLIASPFLPRNVFNFEVIPVLALTTIGSLAGEDLGKIGDFFRRDYVNFMGMNLAPIGALGLRLSTALFLVLANATWEEIAFRGLSLERGGVFFSSVSFGAAHLPNMLHPDFSVEDTILQTLTAMAFGFYTSHQVKRGGYMLDRAIALHFWNNVLALTLDYMLEPDRQRSFTVGYRFSF